MYNQLLLVLIYFCDTFKHIVNSDKIIIAIRDKTDDVDEIGSSMAYCLLSLENRILDL